MIPQSQGRPFLPVTWITLYKESAQSFGVTFPNISALEAELQ